MNKNRLKIFIILLMCSVMFVKTLKAQEKDPEIMNAMLDSKNTSNLLDNTVSIDPLEQTINNEVKKEENKVKVVELVKEVKKEEKKKIVPKKPDVIKLTAEESEMLKNMDKKSSDSVEQKVSQNRKAIYVPAPVETKSIEDTLVDRDSSKIVTRTLGHNDMLNVEMCSSGGLTIMLDKSIEGEFTQTRADEPDLIAVDQIGKRGAFLHLKRDPGSQMFETAVRFEQEDKTYVVNVVGVGCPSKGLAPFPKVIYIKNRPKLDSKGTMTPEDNIIQLSKGLPRIQKNRIRIYDMVMDAGSDWAIFGVEVQLPNTENIDKMKLPKMIVLDNLQLSNLNDNAHGLGKVGWDYLPLQSQKASELRGAVTMRYKLTVPINKNYILKRRYIHLMYLDEEGQYYQYIRVDTLPYFYSLLKRGLEL